MITIGGNQELNAYVMNAQGITRKGLNIMCFIGIFIFGWLLKIVFEDLGKKSMGWLYIVLIVVFYFNSLHGDFSLSIFAPFLYVIGWAHANFLLSNYQNLARKRIIALNNEPTSADNLLEKGILYQKVLNDKETAFSVFEEVLTKFEDGTPDLLNLGGKALLKIGSPKIAITFFDRALASTPEASMAELIKKNRKLAEMAVTKK